MVYVIARNKGKRFMAKTAGIILIGNELLTGRTHDVNLHWLAGRLSALGIRTLEAAVIPDIEDVIVHTVQRFSGLYDYVFTTGGIGPTHDDITTDCIAKAFGTHAEHQDEAVSLLTRHYRPDELNEARLRMARIPVGAELIANPVSAAPGFRIRNVYVMAGVPRIMQAMFEQLQDQLEGGPARVARTLVLHRTEGDIAQALGEIQASLPNVEIGSYPFIKQGLIGTSLVVRGEDAAAVTRAIAALEEMARSTASDYHLMDGEQ